MRDNCKILHDWTAKVIKAKRVEYEKSKDTKAGHRKQTFVDLLFSIKDEDGNPLNDQDIKEESNTFLFAG